MIWFFFSSWIWANWRQPPITSNFLVWSNWGSSLTMQLLSDTYFLLHSCSISGRKASLCLHTYSDSFISWADSFPFLVCPRNCNHLGIHAVILTKCCQVSYLVANPRVLFSTDGRQTRQLAWSTLSASFLGSTRHSGAVCLNGLMDWPTAMRLP